MNKHNNKKLILTEAGMVSIIVTVIIMIVLSLIVMGFAQLSRREQRQALDRQLSTQAFYAAESGINDARKALANGITANKISCAPDANYTASNIINVAADIQYTCLLIDQNPPSLKYTIDAGKSAYANMSFYDSAGTLTNATYIEVYWRGDDPLGLTPSGFSSPQLPKLSDWNDGTNMLNSLLRVTLTDLGTNGFSRSGLDKSYTAFLYPRNGGIATTVSANFTDPAVQSAIVDSYCNTTTKRCMTTINGLNTNNLFIRMNPIYNKANVEIKAYNTTSQLKIRGAQAVIDSTGKANDVLRRVQVRIPVKDLFGPVFSVQSVTGICKQYSVWPGGGTGAEPANCGPIN